MATRFKSVIVLLTLALAMGCVSPAPLPTATPEPFLARQLDVKIDPKEAATFLLNPSPLGKGGYSQGMVVTIDILPKRGWQVDEWVGPVFNIDGKTAKIQMDSSQTVAVRLKSTTPTNTPTDTPIPPTPIPPTDTPIPPTATPYPPVRPTPTPFPKANVIKATLTPSPHSHYRKGKEYKDDGKYQLAIDEFTNAIRLNRNYVPAYIIRGNAYSLLGQQQRAIQDFDQAIRLQPDNAIAYNNRGGDYGRMGQHQRAILDFDKAIELKPDYAKTYNNRGLAYNKLGQYAKRDDDKFQACIRDTKYC